MISCTPPLFSFSRMYSSSYKSCTICSSSSFNKYYSITVVKLIIIYVAYLNIIRLIIILLYHWINYGLNVPAYSVTSNPHKSYDRVVQGMYVMWYKLASHLLINRLSPYPGSVLFGGVELNHLRWPSILLNACIILILLKRFRILPSRSTTTEFLLYLTIVPLVTVMA